jgi:hypothetical protein
MCLIFLGGDILGMNGGNLLSMLVGGITVSQLLSINWIEYGLITEI